LTDIVSPLTRSQMMALVKSKNTKPELIVRRFLHRLGYRYRLHARKLPGQPDLVLAKYNTVVFVHGCFWHQHTNCRYATMPSSREEFWKQKLTGNLIRDNIQTENLNLLGWKVLVIWECGLKHNIADLDEVLPFFTNHDLKFYWPTVPPKRKASVDPINVTSQQSQDR
jgi:DNA mismatch endonuclease (patch repair protein)